MVLRTSNKRQPRDTSTISESDGYSMKNKYGQHHAWQSCVPVGRLVIRTQEYYV